MKILIQLLIFFTLTPSFIYAQMNVDNTKTESAESYFDFWLGTWDLSWKDADGSIGTGTNHVERILDGKVIKENFEVRTGAFKGFVGKSYSVYQPQFETWKQTWVDNSGGYLDFIGDVDDGKHIFKREGVNPEGMEILQRMVFYDIKDNSMTWDWEISENNGKSWQLKWRINYKRVNNSSEN